MSANYSQDAAAHNPEMMETTTVDALLDGVSRDVPTPGFNRRTARLSNGHRYAGMRVVKPASASGSPRGPAALSRRKTVLSETPYSRRPMFFNQAAVSPAGMGPAYNSTTIGNVQQSRPVSWHPSSQNSTFPASTASPYQQAQYDNSFMSHHGMPSLPATPAEYAAAYSGYTTPMSSFSPISMPYNYYEQPATYCEKQQYFPDKMDSSAAAYDPFVQQTIQQSVDIESFSQGTPANGETVMYTQYDWDGFAGQTYADSTSPPTPDNFLPIQHPETSFTPEENIIYHSLSDPEPVGEVLVGMGLYDTPEKEPAADPQLDNYRALISQLLGTPQRKEELAKGKGLKLEETWNPPPSDEEEEEEEEEDCEEEDDDDKDDDENVEHDGDDIASGKQPSHAMFVNSSTMYNGGNGQLVQASSQHFAPNEMQTAFQAVTYNSIGWL